MSRESSAGFFDPRFLSTRCTQDMNRHADRALALITAHLLCIKMSVVAHSRRLHLKHRSLSFIRYLTSSLCCSAFFLWIGPSWHYNIYKNSSRWTQNHSWPWTKHPAEYGLAVLMCRDAAIWSWYRALISWIRYLWQSIQLNDMFDDFIILCTFNYCVDLEQILA